MASITDQELRALVRQGIDQHMPVARTAPAPVAAPAPALALHASHLLLLLPDTGDGPCVIEPSVPCTHCGYCKSLGH